MSNEIFLGIIFGMLVGLFIYLIVVQLPLRKRKKEGVQESKEIKFNVQVVKSIHNDTDCFVLHEEDVAAATADDAMTVVGKKYLRQHPEMHTQENVYLNVMPISSNPATEKNTNE